MRVRIIVMVLTVFIGFGGMAAVQSAEAQEPAYAKYGKLAMQETAKKYKADIVDYKYEGHFPQKGKVAEERFVLWLREGDEQFGVRVSIQVDQSSDKVQRIQFDKLESH